MSKKQLHEVSLIFLYETDKAVQVTDGIEDAEGRTKKVWLPKSQIETEVAIVDMEVKKAYTFTIPEWLVEEKELDHLIT